MKPLSVENGDLRDKSAAERLHLLSDQIDEEITDVRSRKVHLERMDKELSHKLESLISMQAKLHLVLSQIQVDSEGIKITTATSRNRRDSPSSSKTSNTYARGQRTPSRTSHQKDSQNNSQSDIRVKFDKLNLNSMVNHFEGIWNHLLYGEKALGNTTTEEISTSPIPQEENRTVAQFKTGEGSIAHSMIFGTDAPRLIARDAFNSPNSELSSTTPNTDQIKSSAQPSAESISLCPTPQYKLSNLSKSREVATEASEADSACYLRRKKQTSSERSVQFMNEKFKELSEKDERKNRNSRSHSIPRKLANSISAVYGPENLNFQRSITNIRPDFKLNEQSGICYSDQNPFTQLLRYNGFVGFRNGSMFSPDKSRQASRTRSNIDVGRWRNEMREKEPKVKSLNSSPSRSVETQKGTDLYVNPVNLFHKYGLFPNVLEGKLNLKFSKVKPSPSAVRVSSVSNLSRPIGKRINKPNGLKNVPLPRNLPGAPSPSLTSFLEKAGSEKSLEVVSNRVDSSTNTNTPLTPNGSAFVESET